MSNIIPSWVRVEPSYLAPEILIQFSQASGAFDALAGGNPLVRLSDGDLYAYIKRLDIRTRAQNSQAAPNQLPSVMLAANMISTPSYLIRVRAEYDHHDQAAGGRWGISVPEAQRLGMRQAIFQALRNNLLYGVNGANGEGLLNGTGITTVNLPADSNGNTTVTTYDNGQMATFLLTQLLNAKTRMMQLGEPVRACILGPQRVLGLFEYPNIVQLTQFQRPGSGTTTTAGLFKEVAKWNGDEIDWLYDDTLIGQGSGGTDAVLIVIPEIKKPFADKINTNEFANLTPGLDACTLMYCDMAAPREITAPLAGGAIDVVSELRSTSGWTVRPEGVTVISMTYP